MAGHACDCDGASDLVQPASVPPLGNGSPYMGLYVAAATTIIVTCSTNWRALTGGSGPGGLPNDTDTIKVYNNATLIADTNGTAGNILLGEHNDHYSVSSISPG
jgi:hypothetical protein